MWRASDLTLVLTRASDSDGQRGWASDQVSQIPATTQHVVVTATMVRDVASRYQEAGAPGGIRTPDLLIRSPMPAEAASLGYFVLSRAARTARFGLRSG